MNTSKLRELSEQATPGPWGGDYKCSMLNLDTGQDVAEFYGSKDALFVEEMRNSLPALLDRLDKLEAVAGAAQNLQIHIKHDDVGYDDFEAAVETMDAALAALEKV